MPLIQSTGRNVLPDIKIGKIEECIYGNTKIENRGKLI
jgi:hypothetical protein